MSASSCFPQASPRATGTFLASHEAASGCQPICDGSTYTMPQRLTVAGEAAARSCTSKIMFMEALIWMISPAGGWGGHWGA
jgi:hypothetical protein